MHADECRHVAHNPDGLHGSVTDENSLADFGLGIGGDMGLNLSGDLIG
jgi:hypothetical protein